MPIIDKIQLSGTVYTIGNETTTAVTSASTDNEIPTAKAVYDAIPQGGGGKAINAGTNISVTTGETADTINCTLPITVSSIKYYFGENNTIGSIHRINYGFIFGAYNTVNGIDSRNEAYHYIIGNDNTDYGAYNTIIGAYNTVKNRYPNGTLNSILIGDNNVSSADTSYNVSNRILIGSHLSCLSDGEIALGRYNISTGDTLFSIGDGNYAQNKHNAFEIKNNGDIYIVDTNDTSTTSYYQKPMIKLQDALGGGSITVDTALDSGSTNPVANSAITEALNDKVNISDNNVSAFSDYKVALETEKNYTSDNISTFYLGTNKTNNSGTNNLVTITTTDTNYPTITINCSYSNGNITQVRTTSGITSSVKNGVAQITLTGGTLATVVSASSGGVVFLYKQYTSGQTADVVEDTVYDALKELSNNKLDYIYKDEIINSQKTFLWGGSGDKPIIFKQTNNEAKLGFICKNSASTNNELASFEFRPNTFTVDGVQHPLLYFGHYRNRNTANAGVPQTVIGFRQYDQPNAAAYHYLLPLPEKAKTPFSLTTSFKDYYAPMGFKNGSTMITADDTGVVDLSSELGGLKLKKLTQAQYDALATKDSNVLYVIVG